MLERSDAVGIRNARVRPRVDQDPDDLPVRGAAVAQDHRLEERRPPRIVDMVDVDRSPHELPHDLDVAAMGRRDERRPAEAIRARQVRTGPKNGPEDLHVAGFAGRE
jgi:hypothetical protein